MTPKTVQRARPEKSVEVPPGLLASVPAESWQLTNLQSFLRVEGMSPYRPTRREFLIGAGSLLVLAPYGCGGEESGQGGTTSAGTRTVEHAMGTTDVPTDPGRVVTLDTAVVLPTVLNLGVSVVGSTAYEASEPYPEYLSGSTTANVEGVGYLEPNLERIAALDPDLIVGGVLFAEGIYEELSRIAPTVALELSYADWKEDSRKIAAVFGKPDEIDARIEDFEDRVRELQAALDERLDDPTVSFIRILPDEVRIHTQHHFAGRILEEAGLRRPPQQLAEDSDKTIIEISSERLMDADADVLFYVAGGGGIEESAAREALRRARENPLWNQLGAVKAGRAYEVEESHWLTGGVRAANRVLDDLFDYLIEEGP